jgi:hypothetical protein
MTFRRQNGHVRRVRGWWMIDYLQFSLDGQNKLVRKRVIAQLTPALTGAWGCMLLPPASVMKAQCEYMAAVNKTNRETLNAAAGRNVKVKVEAED